MPCNTGELHPFQESLWFELQEPNPKGSLLVSEPPILRSSFSTLGHILLKPLTGKVWKLEDFESYPALVCRKLLAKLKQKFGKAAFKVEVMATVVMFICNHCPFVIHLKKDIVKLSNFYLKKGLAVVAVSSNSVATHPQVQILLKPLYDPPDFMAEDARLYNYPFPYLYDESQDVARDFGAACTPEFFLFKKDGRRPFELVYHGQFDDSRPSNNVRVTGRLGPKHSNRSCSQWPNNGIRSKTQRWMQHKVASREIAVMFWVEMGSHLIFDHLQERVVTSNPAKKAAEEELMVESHDSRERPSWFKAEMVGNRDMLRNKRNM
ncbi:hypothetical protein RJ639_038545, partial [Escallonia herrerae]